MKKLWSDLIPDLAWSDDPNGFKSDKDTRRGGNSEAFAQFDKNKEFFCSFWPNKFLFFFFVEAG